MQFELKPFSQSTTTVSVELVASVKQIELTYRIADASTDIVWPSYTELHRADRLWETTCLELFIGKDKEDHYFEINLSHPAIKAHNPASQPDGNAGLHTASGSCYLYSRTFLRYRYGQPAQLLRIRSW